MINRRDFNRVKPQHESPPTMITMPANTDQVLFGLLLSPAVAHS